MRHMERLLAQLPAAGQKPGSNLLLTYVLENSGLDDRLCSGGSKKESMQTKVFFGNFVSREASLTVPKNR